MERWRKERSKEMEERGKVGRRGKGRRWGEEGREEDWRGRRGKGGEEREKQRKSELCVVRQVGELEGQTGSMHCYPADLPHAFKMLAHLLNLQKDGASAMPNAVLPYTCPSRHTLKGTVTQSLVPRLAPAHL